MRPRRFLKRTPRLKAVSRVRWLNARASSRVVKKRRRTGNTEIPIATFSTTDSDKSKNQTFLDRAKYLISKDATVAPEKFNRWVAFPGTFLVQISIGSVYAWSIFNNPLTREFGVVTAAANDWTLGSVVNTFSLAAVSLGLTTFFLGPWCEQAGPRKVSLLAATVWGSGLCVSALGTYTHMLPLLYLGYGVLGGAGWGFGYISPVSNLLKWFPDRRGLGTGLALTVFGGGAIVAGPLNQKLLNNFFVAPDYLGPADVVNMVTEGGKRFVDVGGEWKEVVVASTSDLAKLGTDGLVEGVYVVGTGDTGATMTFFSLGVGYFTIMLCGAFMQKIPHPKWKPDGWTPDEHAETARQENAISSVEALSTKQFWLLWAAVWGNAFAGVSIIACAKNMMTECWGPLLPAIVTSSFCANYVASLSAANAVGRFGWANISDLITRKGTYYVFGLSIPTAISLPYLMQLSTEQVAAGVASYAPLALFTGGTIWIVSCYGGTFSVLPPYLLETFGSRHVGAIHGKVLTAWAAAAVTGPNVLAKLRQRTYNEYVEELTSNIDPVNFEQKFGTSVDNLQELVDAKTVTITKLLEISQPGTTDPTPFLYDTTMCTMAGILGVAILCNSQVHPIAGLTANANAQPKNKIHKCFPMMSGKVRGEEMPKPFKSYFQPCITEKCIRFF